MNPTAVKLLLIWALVLTALLVMGMASLTQFAPNTVISSSEVNANFDAVKQAVDALETAVAAQATSSSQGVWHTWSAPTPLGTTVSTTLLTLASTTLTTATPEDAVLGLRVEGTVDVAGPSGMILLVRLMPSDGVPGTLSSAQIELSVGAGQSFSSFGNWLHADIPVTGFSGSYEVRVDAQISGSGTTQFSLTSLRTKVLVLERTTTSDPSPRFE